MIIRYLYKCITALLLMILTAACSLTVNTGTSNQPTVIFVPVTVTPGPIQEQPTNTPGPLPTNALPTATTVAATATSELLHFYVSGTVWLDTCKPYNVIPNPIPDGCVLNNGTLAADGIYKAGEPGIGGVTIRLEIDCNYGAFTTATDVGGNYSMSFTVPKSAGVSQQKICLSINATSPENSSILIPGGWTLPATNSSTALIQITIPVEQQNTVNFGWDYQFR